MIHGPLTDGHWETRKGGIKHWVSTNPPARSCAGEDCTTLIPETAHAGIIYCDPCDTHQKTQQRRRERARVAAAKRKQLKRIQGRVHVSALLRTLCEGCGCLTVLGEDCPGCRVWARQAEQNWHTVSWA